ncbi:DUF2934 domain-containing protein [Dyella sp. 2HG41-7]|uniref:DUF2934 domain-containing protein n=1 Tax=Dyella sp. 2HG41-7 TaxID=2883239 RepID=UPI001F2AD233|nr:DUF2934 domain-containing protein [Dyella sp. 2HG41-7]
MKSKHTSAERQARIRDIAHSIWESEGRPVGQSLRHWYMAERLVLAEEQHAAHAPPEKKDAKPGKKKR